MVAGVAVAECHACAGLWLTNSAFSRLARQACSQAGAVDHLLVSPSVAVAACAETHEGPWRYRKCPECGILMNRRNYGPGSGVVVDMCRSHGVWFDAEELPAILDWIRRGGPAQTEQERTAERLRTDRYRQALAAKPIGGAAHEHPSSPGNPILDFAHMLIELSRWF